MTTQYMPKTTQVSVYDECGSWIDRGLAAAVTGLIELRSHRLRAGLRKVVGRLTRRQLEDMGLDDPRRQIAAFGAPIANYSADRDYLRNLDLIRR